MNNLTNGKFNLKFTDNRENEIMDLNITDRNTGKSKTFHIHYAVCLSGENRTETTVYTFVEVFPTEKSIEKLFEHTDGTVFMFMYQPASRRISKGDNGEIKSHFMYHIVLVKDNICNKAGIM